jgi:hypothetical protein
LKTNAGIANLEKERAPRPGEDVELTTSDEEKAEVLLDFFSSIFTTEDKGTMPPFDSRNVQSVLEYIDVTDDKVKSFLLKLNTSKSPGPDGLHPRVLKELAEIINKPLCVIYQQSLTEGVLPSEWKSANISPIFKKGSKKKASNYRPISLSCIVCKGLERLLRDDLTTHMIENNLFSDKQYGFIKGRSTTLQLLHMLDKWTDVLDQGEQLDAIYFDYMKAFDTVPHARLLHKIKGYGIGAHIISWIEAFITGRKQRVNVNGSKSRWTEVISGIPQGTVLGPLLFVIFVNDIPEILHNGTDIYMFADDTTFFRTIKSMTDNTIVQADITNLESWSDKWLLRYHPDKCKVI